MKNNQKIRTIVCIELYKKRSYSVNAVASFHIIIYNTPHCLPYQP